ncbi:YtrH family sporulation protein [Paenibacillus sp. J2TS4]|uniref:YtrH family sporulation protein n=1 Tax=Paenibacillus sp. J2TS4 TaxID=2807194 RepID=UPI001B031CFE|nr:YtrH family sporulation protein [Paenibacillus sp. J2TS4]GIP33697.1 sporulation protein [Paenibacillus sp. J2TS4]
MTTFLTKLTMDFFIAFGIVLGGSMLGGIAAVFILQPPAVYMLKIAGNIKIWAMVAAVGGTIDPLRVIEFNFTEGYLSPAIKQILYFIVAFIGAQMAYQLIQWICEGAGSS